MIANSLQIITLKKHFACVYSGILVDFSKLLENEIKVCFTMLRLNLFILLFLFGICLIPVFGQEKMNKGVQGKNLFTNISLAEAFANLERNYHINIVYKENLIREKEGVPVFQISNNIYRDLDVLLSKLSLTYELVGSKTFVIIPMKLANKGIIHGVVSDRFKKALENANVYLEGTTLGSSTDKNGYFTIVNIPTGTYNLTIKYIGFKTWQRNLYVTPGQKNELNIVLDADVLDYESIVVTGIRKPLPKLKTSIAITTLNPAEISERAPQNTADLLKAIPGFYVESSGGEGGNNLFARGIPSDGSYRYVSLQEDGFPVFEDCELMFANADIFVRVDETLDHVEGVRGGTGSIYASNAPGGIINFISKVGGDVLEGIVKTSIGDYNHFRTDLNVSGALSQKWRFNIGGFYRYDDGIRSPGFPANRGGQVKLNITHLLENGSLRFYAKFLDDRNVFYQPIPLQDKENPRGIPGFDPNYGTLTSDDANYLSLTTPKGEHFEESLDEGIHPNMKSLGGEINYTFLKNLVVKNSFRYTTIKHKFNAIFSLNDPYFTNTFAEDIARFSNWRYQYTNSNELIEVPENLNNNGLIAEVGWWSVKMPMFNFANYSEVYLNLGKHSLSAAYYISDYSTKPAWFWQNILLDVSDNPKRIDLIDLDTNISYTKNGFSRFGSYYLNFRMDGLVNAFRLVDDYKYSDRLSFDVGIRFEKGSYSGYVENNYTENRFDNNGQIITDNDGNPVEFGYDLGDSTTLADDNVNYGDGTSRLFEYDYTQLAFSCGANLLINKKLATYLRLSKGFRTPDDQHFVFFESGSYKLEHIYQLESGLKYSTKHFAFFSSIFMNLFNNLPFADEVVDPDTDRIVRAFRFADSRTIGAEIEAVAKLGNWNLDITATVQDPRYLNYEFVGRKEDFSHNRVRRIPTVFYELRPAYILKKIKFFGNIRYIGNRFTDDANTGVLPAYTAYNAGLEYAIGHTTLALNGSNLTNVIGLTEGNPRVDNTLDPNNYFFMARPILGRAFKLSLKYTF
ncbi:MAG: PEGA domain-containing protein [Calditrichaeota bacterium]|nr:MAG: PEGA domain-containing protein [Calditrichota bacterium]